MTRPHRLAALPLLALAIGLLPGCIRLGNPTDLRLESILDDAVITSDFSVRTYIPFDKNTADLYFSDIPSERLLDPSDNLANAVGSILHIHLFLVPVAGETPIDATACNVTVRQIVLAGPRGASGKHPAMGIYGGGGFLLPDDNPGANSLGGNLFDATLKLTHSTPGFVDRLGAARMSGTLSARRDDALSTGMARRFNDLLDASEPLK